MRRPVGLVLIAILYWFGAFWMLLLGAILALGATIFSAAMAGVPSMIAGLGIVGGIFLMGLGAAVAFVGYGLFTSQEWARMTAIILAAIGIVFGVLAGIGISGRVLRLAINAVILWYLNQPQVKMYFRRT